MDRVPIDNRDQDQPPEAPSAGPDSLARPRLADLFVLSFFLAVFLTFCRYAFACDANFAIWPLNDFELVGYGIGVACCWTGVYRMLRPYGRGPLRPAEWQPGEIICLVEGVYYLSVAVIGALLRSYLLKGLATIPDDDPDFGDFNYATVAALYLLPAIGMSVAYGVMASWVTVPAWRWGAVAKSAGHLLGAVLLFLITSSFLGDYYAAPSYLLMLCFVVPTGMVLFAAVFDRNRRGVHWMHWMGIAAFTFIYASRFSLELRVLLEPVE